jgi:hypothetical protein
MDAIYLWVASLIMERARRRLEEVFKKVKCAFPQLSLLQHTKATRLIIIVTLIPTSKTPSETKVAYNYYTDPILPS